MTKRMQFTFGVGVASLASAALSEFGTGPRIGFAGTICPLFGAVHNDNDHAPRRTSEHITELIDIPHPSPPLPFHQVLSIHPPPLAVAALAEAASMTLHISVLPCVSQCSNAALF
ncbi:hypothetical protein M405DRAFT_870324 [Rhizopogon salebrosus TDB-379]|nr:hypothetical protein M405DRAFT_870324 [Rhizopogon salebrosus TDB-379]